MLAVLPKRQSDDLSGELFVASYQRILGDRSEPEISFLAEQSVRYCRWFPTIAECLEHLGEWRRDDEHTTRRAYARSLVDRERSARRTEYSPPPPPPLRQSDVDGMSDRLVKIGLACGALVRDDDGAVRPAE